ncbi:LAMI_0E16468g1_1 [Lachancea mirantina]|uniref:LAMI_0E16468g1_1 n=1 Tax=Lachancea mirantina TaxID=1230905 RepID=A0A1G4JT39_9SACH|nr:LAMI_0E16468g1_1 [Lachancea mirantina]
MSIVSFAVSEDNPVTKKTVEAQLNKLGVSLLPGEEDEFHKFLAAAHETARSVEAMCDYKPQTDLVRFPRKNVQSILGKDALGAWVYKFDLQDTNENHGPLAGVSICIKDCIGIASIPQVMGTDCWDPWVPSADATVVTRLLEAGAKIVGTSNCEQLCAFTGSHTSCLGNVHNPYLHGHSAGGSSSGSAALVAANEADMALGADQGGSIRIPAAMCGLVGLKPTFGLVPYTGITSNEYTLDHVGPMTKTVEQNVTLLQVLAGSDLLDDRQSAVPLNVNFEFKEPRKLTIGILKEAFEAPFLDEAMKQKVFSAIDKFREVGYNVVEVSIPMHAQAPELWSVIERVSGLHSRLGHASGRRLYSDPEFFKHTNGLGDKFFSKAPVNVRNSIINGLYFEENFPGIFAKATNLVLKLQSEYNKALSEVDLLVLPTTPFCAPQHGPREGLPTERVKSTFGVNINTCPFNLSGHPALSLPIGFLPCKTSPSQKLPVGMQVVGKHFDESTIYTAAFAWEQHFDWRLN